MCHIWHIAQISASVVRFVLSEAEIFHYAPSLTCFDNKLVVALIILSDKTAQK